MNIKNFESVIDKTIQQRGLEYYKSGCIESLEFDGEEWVAEVSGSDDYIVTVKLNSSEDIISTGCDCPYDWGMYCKHQAAVFYALRKELENPNNKSTEAPANQSLEDLLKNQEKNVLIKILLEYAKQDRKIKQDLLFRFAEKGKDIIEYARNIIKKSIKRVMRRGFIEYDDVEDAAEGANQVLKMAEGITDDILSCVSLCSVILEEMMDLYNCCEDFDDIDDVIGCTVELLTNVIETIPDNYPETEKAFDMIFTHVLKSGFGGYDWKEDLLYACIPCCRLPKIRKRIEDYLLLIQINNKYDGRREAQNILREIIEKFDGVEAADAYIEQNLDNRDFREIAIQKAMDENRLDRALKLCLEGEIADGAYIGVVWKWKEMRYSIYERHNNTESQKKLAYEFVLDGKFEYFLKLKKLYRFDEWEKILQNLLSVLKNSRSQNIYVDILVHEEKKQLLLEYCEKYMSAVVKLYSHLLPEYIFEVEMIFLEYIRKEAGSASDRKGYNSVCEIIKHLNKACGSQKANELKTELLQKYAKRPAFVDELKKI